jgi:hypothetical protein
MRFFTRAIALYDQGLQSYPMSLDLAFNKFVVRSDLFLPFLVAYRRFLTQTPPSPIFCWHLIEPGRNMS